MDNKKSMPTHHTFFHQKHDTLTEQAYGNEDQLPSRYVFVLTSACNLSCDFCFQRSNTVFNTMTDTDWIAVIEQIPDHARVTLTGGEPLMLKGFQHVFTQVAHRLDCNLISNGLLLTTDLIDLMLSKKKFKVLSLSVDDVGNQLRGVSHEKWKRLESLAGYFVRQRDNINPDCILDVKTLVLNENADSLFRTHKYAKERLHCDTHGFQFLKGSNLQHDNRMHECEAIHDQRPVRHYHNFAVIREQLERVRKYNREKKGRTFLHPNMADLSGSQPVPELKMLAETIHHSELFEPCKYPWSSVHINSDGNLFPCLSVSMGNVKDQALADIIQGSKFRQFRQTIRKRGTVSACHCCGWLKPKPA